MALARKSYLGSFALLPLLLAATAHGQERSKDAERLLAEFRRPFERLRVRPEAQVVSSEEKDGLLREKVTFLSQHNVRVPVLIIRAAGAPKKLPTVICLHGLGGNKEGMAPYLEHLAKSGYTAVAIDARYHGDRSGDLQAAMIQSYRDIKERPYIWDTVWDTWRTLDYLQTRPDVDPVRFGVMGISLGGHATWMAAADPRIKVAIPCISVCSWRWSLEHQGYTQRVKNVQRAFDGVAALLGEREVTAKVVAAAWDRWLPGIPKKYDCQDVLAAYAPRPLLIIAGDSDPVAPLEGLQEAYRTIESAYKAAGASDKLKLVLAEHSGHTVTAAHQQAIYDFLDRWLK